MNPVITVRKPEAQVQRVPIVVAVPKPVVPVDFRNQSGLLDGFVPEENSGTKSRFKIENGTVTKEFVRIYKKHFPHLNICYHGDLKRDHLDSDFSKLDYTASDIEKFILLLGSLPINIGSGWQTGYPIGLFLSELINHCKDDDFIIHAAHLDFVMGSFGYYNTKNILVKGSVGDGLGEYMLRGSITVEGNAGSSAGEGMHGGRITIHGNSGWRTGKEMNEGELIICGNSGEGTGHSMYGGTITVKGDALGYAGHSMYGGKLEILGNVGNGVGEQMRDGEITVHGEAGRFVATDMKGGKILILGRDPCVYQSDGLSIRRYPIKQ